MNKNLYSKTFQTILLALLFAFKGIAQDSAICYLRDDNGRIREHNVDFVSMKLSVKFNVMEGKVFGNVLYKFKPIQYVVDTLFLNAPEIKINKVLFNNQTVKFSTTKDGLTILFAKTLNWNNEYSLAIDYEAEPRKGLYFIGWNVNATNSENDKYYTRKQIWTQGQGIDNRHWIPCYDDVNDKMLTETVITFDSAYTVISNGELKSKRLNADGTYTWHYAMSKPMVPYLIMIAIDKYEFKDYRSENGMVSRQYYYADQPQTCVPTYQYSAEMMDWLCNETGVYYPWKTYCNVPVQDFMFGAMENTTATIYGDFLLNDSRMEMERPYTGTNAHELTHQWFGDYITEYSAQHHWLHESFATYYSKQFLRSVQGEEDYQWQKRKEANQAIHADKNDRYPVAHSMGGSARHYPKGSFVIDMLRYVVGDSVYKKCITNYLKKHAFSNVSTHDLQFAFMETAGINLDWFFDEWVYRSGFPKFEVSYSRQANQMVWVVKQTQMTDELSTYYKMPVIFEVYLKDGSILSSRQWVDSASDTFRMDVPNGKEIDFALFDPAGNVLKTIAFSKSFEELSAQVIKAKNMIDRYDALVALRDTAIPKKRSLLLAVFNHEKSSYLKTEVIAQLSQDTSVAAFEVFSRALADTNFLVRRSVVDNLDSWDERLLPAIEKLLEDSSYYTIENTLRKLCKLYPENCPKYLSALKGARGINNNVLIAGLELSCKYDSANVNMEMRKQLVKFSSNQYEFRTRIRAMEALERINYFDLELCNNLFNACLNANQRLANPAAKVYKYFLQNSTNKQTAEGTFSIGKWRDWERKILETQLK